MAAGGARGRRPPKKAKGKPRPRKQAPAKAAAASPRRPARGEVRRRRAKRDLTRRLVVTGAVLAVAGFLIYSAASRGAEGRSIVDRLESGPGSCRVDTRFDGTKSEQDDHIPSPTFEFDPPAGGAHEPSAAPPGFYRGDDAPSDGKLVHAMEHGFVVLWYRPDLPPEDQRSIDDLSDRFGRELIVVPRPSIDGEVAVTAWHRRMLCERLDAEAVALFTTSYKDQGPEKGFL